MTPVVFATMMKIHPVGKVRTKAAVTMTTDALVSNFCATTGDTSTRTHTTYTPCDARLMTTSDM